MQADMFVQNFNSLQQMSVEGSFLAHLTGQGACRGAEERSGVPFQAGFELENTQKCSFNHKLLYIGSPLCYKHVKNTQKKIFSLEFFNKSWFVCRARERTCVVTMDIW